MLKSFTPHLSSHGALFEFKSTVPLIPKYFCPSVWAWKADVPLPVLSILVSPKWSLSTLTGREILPENTAIGLAVGRLRENNFSSHFTGSQSRLLLGSKSSLFRICVYTYIYGQFFICGFCPHLQSLNHNSEIQKVLRTVIFRQTHLMTKPDLNWCARNNFKSLFFSLWLLTAVWMSFIKGCFPDPTGGYYRYGMATILLF